MNDSKEFLGKEVTVKIDRPLWSLHPKHGFIYEINYWFVADTISWDWEELDAYVLWVEVAVQEFSGKCIAIIKRTNDNDDKLIVAPAWVNYSDEEITKLTNFQEKYFQSVIIR